jgi:hypothetical protein
MRQKTLLAIGFSLLNLGSVSFPALAETPQIVNKKATNRVSVLSKSTAISFLVDKKIIFEKDMKELTVNVPLYNSVLDSNNYVAVPAKSSVTIGIKKADGGAEIAVKSIVIGNRVVPLKTSSVFVPSITISEKNPDELIGKAAQTAADIAISGGIIFDSSIELMEKLDGAGAVGGALYTYARGKVKKKAVIIPQGTTYTVSLESPIFVN